MAYFKRVSQNIPAAIEGKDGNSNSGLRALEPRRSLTKIGDESLSCTVRTFDCVLLVAYLLPVARIIYYRVIL